MYEPVNPMDEAAKQYYRDNPAAAARDTVAAMRIFFWIVVFSALLGVLMKAFA